MEWKKYIIVFVITLAVFLLAFFASNQIGDKRVNQLREIQNKLSVDILSTETRFSLLEQSSCAHVIADDEFEVGITSELNDLARRVKFLESQLGLDNPDVVALKKHYSLLQIKDYLLVQELGDRCDHEIFTMLYFHENDCRECHKQTIVLDEVRDRYPEVRVYWFDKDLITPAVQTLVSMFDIEKAPALLLSEGLQEQFLELEEIEALLPEEIVQAYIERTGEETEETEEVLEAEEVSQ